MTSPRRLISRARRLAEQVDAGSLLSREGSFQAGVAWNVASLMVLGISGIAINFLIARWGSPEDLGVFNQAYAVYILASQLAVGGVQYSVLHYISWRSSDQRECRKISSSALLLAAGLSILVAALLAATHELAGTILESRAVSLALLAVCPGLVLFSLNKVLLSILNGFRQMRAFAVFQSLRFAFILAGVAAMLLLDVDGAYLAGSFTIAEALLFPGLIAYVERRAVPIRPRHVEGRWLKRHSHFGVRSFVSGTLTELNTRVDVLTLGFFLSDGIVGVYSFAAIFAEGFNQIPYVVRNSLDPLLGARFAERSLSRIEEYSRKIRHIFWPMMTVAGLMGIAAYAALLRLFFAGSEFADSLGVFVILVLGVVLSAGYRPFLGILLQGGRPTAYTILVAAVVVFNLIGNLLLIPVLGIIGAAIATAAALLVEAALVVTLSRRLFGVRL